MGKDSSYHAIVDSARGVRLDWNGDFTMDNTSVYIVINDAYIDDVIGKSKSNL